MVQSVIAATQRKSMCPSTSRGNRQRGCSLACSVWKGKTHAKTTACHPASFIGKGAERDLSQIGPPPRLVQTGRRRGQAVYQQPGKDKVQMRRGSLARGPIKNPRQPWTRVPGGVSGGGSASQDRSISPKGAGRGNPCLVNRGWPVSVEPWTDPDHPVSLGESSLFCSSPEQRSVCRDEAASG
jgi:hypothetical protein